MSGLTDTEVLHPLAHEFVGFPSGPRQDTDTGYPPISDPGQEKGSLPLEFIRTEITDGFHGIVARYDLSGTIRFPISGPLHTWGADDVTSVLGDVTNMLFWPT